MGRSRHRGLRRGRGARLATSIFAFDATSRHCGRPLLAGPGAPEGQLHRGLGPVDIYRMHTKAQTKQMNDVNRSASFS